MLSKEQFKKIIKNYGYEFDENNVYTCKDGKIYLFDSYLMIENKVIASEFNNCVYIQYPDCEDENMELKYASWFVDDFKYHLSYSAYKDYMNFETPDYKEIFTTNIFELYVTHVQRDGDF